MIDRFTIPDTDVQRVMSYTESILGIEVHYFESFYMSQDPIDWDEFDIRDLYIYLNHTLFTQNLRTLRPDLRVELMGNSRRVYGLAGYRRSGQDLQPTYIKLNRELIISKRALMETFVHEMVHIYNYEYDNYDGGHGKPFYDAYYQVGFRERNFGIPRARSREHVWSNMSWGEASGLEHTAKALFRVGQQVLNPYTDEIEPIVKVLKSEVVLASGQKLFWTALVNRDNYLQVPETVELPVVDQLLLEHQIGMDDFVAPEQPEPVVLTTEVSKNDRYRRILERTRRRKRLSEQPPENLYVKVSDEDKSKVGRFRIDFYDNNNKKLGGFSTKNEQFVGTLESFLRVAEIDIPRGTSMIKLYSYEEVQSVRSRRVPEIVYERRGIVATLDIKVK